MQSKEMNTDEGTPKDKAPSRVLVSGRRRVSKVLPAGYSWLSVPLPTRTLNNLNHMARVSNLSLRSYMERFCEEAVDYPTSLVSNVTAPEQAKNIPEKC